MEIKSSGGKMCRSIVLLCFYIWKRLENDPSQIVREFHRPMRWRFERQYVRIPWNVAPSAAERGLFEKHGECDLRYVQFTVCGVDNCAPVGCDADMADTICGIITVV